MAIKKVVRFILAGLFFFPSVYSQSSSLLLSSRCDGEYCPPPTPCHDLFIDYPLCRFTEGVTRMIVDWHRLRDVVFDGIPVLVKEVKYFLSTLSPIQEVTGFLALPFTLVLKVPKVIEKVFHISMGLVLEILRSSNPLRELKEDIAWGGLLTFSFMASVAQGEDTALARSGFEKFMEDVVNLALHIITGVYERIQPIIKYLEHIIDMIRNVECKDIVPVSVCQFLSRVVRYMDKIVEKAYEKIVKLMNGPIFNVVDKTGYFIYSLLKHLVFPQSLNDLHHICKKFFPDHFCSQIRDVILKVDKAGEHVLNELRHFMVLVNRWANKHIFIDV